MWPSSIFVLQHNFAVTKEVKTLKSLTVLCPPGSFGNTCGFCSYDDVHLSLGQAYTYIHGGLLFLNWLASYGMIDHVMH